MLVAPRGQTQRVREIVDEPRAHGASEHQPHLTVQRPWGSYTVLEQAADFKVKRITGLAGASLSLQRHQHRFEYWIVVSGSATVTRADETVTVTKNHGSLLDIYLYVSLDP